jgi:prepilin-type N-terminal cleavage/methylation domain-containing protein
VKYEEQRGFTLIEVLVSMGFSLAVLASIYGLFRAQTHTVKGQEGRMEAHEYAMSVLDTIVREIRNTGYFPTSTACSNVGNTQGIVTAAAQSYRLVYDTNADGSCEEDVSFTYDSTTGRVLWSFTPASYAKLAKNSPRNGRGR